MAGGDPFEALPRFELAAELSQGGLMQQRSSGDTVVVSNTALLRTGLPVKVASGADQN